MPFFITLFIILIDVIVYSQLDFLFLKKISKITRRIILSSYGLFTLGTIITFLIYYISKPYHANYKTYFLVMILVSSIIIVYLTKILTLIFIFINFIVNVFIKLINIVNKKNYNTKNIITKVGFFLNIFTLSLVLYGIFWGRLDFKVHKHIIFLPNLPSSFDGIKIAHISDIHAGSFFSEGDLLKGINLLLKEKPDIIFFTGDLVNFDAHEAERYYHALSLIKAPLGVYSILGNHDYGDYAHWENLTDKNNNLKELINIHKKLGWVILLNENAIISKNNQNIAILGVENWSTNNRFHKKGIISKAYAGLKNIPIKLLLTHDPSQWDAQIINHYNDINITFSGHTHAFQFGYNILGHKWSPSQYIYKEWDGLYQQNHQYLNVNRGFGYIGYPGRIGMPPVIDIIILKKK